MNKIFLLGLLLLPLLFLLFQRFSANYKPPCQDEECKRNIIVLIKNVSTILNKYDIRYWADFGTLLGMVRDKSVIHGDDDADFSFDMRDIDQLKLALEDIKKTYPQYSILVRCNNIIKVIDGHTVLDLFPFVIHNTQLISGHTSDDDVDEKVIYPLKMVIYPDTRYGVFSIYTPNDSHTRLSLKYGDYMTPKQDWGNKYSIYLNSFIRRYSNKIELCKEFGPPGWNYPKEFYL